MPDYTCLDCPARFYSPFLLKRPKCRPCQSAFNRQRALAYHAAKRAAVKAGEAQAIERKLALAERWVKQHSPGVDAWQQRDGYGLMADQGEA